MLDRLQGEVTGLRVGRLLLEGRPAPKKSLALRAERLGEAFRLSLEACRRGRAGLSWRPEVDLCIAAHDLVELHLAQGRPDVAFATGTEALRALASSPAQTAPWFYESRLVLSLLQSLLRCLEAPELVLPSLDEVELLLTLEDQILGFRAHAA